MNLESFIKTYLVDRNRRKSFRSVLSGWEFLSGLHRDGGEVPGALPGLIEALKKRDPSERLPVFDLADKYAYPRPFPHCVGGSA